MSDTLDQWRAGLTLGFAPGHAGRTVLRERTHYGPMLVQRALYPEGPQVCHVAILHPPSGIAGGDALEIRVDVAGGARAALTTPGATRWYKSNGRQASQDVQLRVAAGARLDWLPLESIFFEEADALSRNRIRLESGAAAIGWDLIQLGRVNQPGHWSQGRLHTATELYVDDRLLWVDQGLVGAQDDVRRQVSALAGFPVHAALWCFGPRLDAGQNEELAGLMPWSDTVRGAATTLPYDATQSLCLVRCLGVHMEDVRSVMTEAWAYLRPRVLDTPAVVPRLWAT